AMDFMTEALGIPIHHEEEPHFVSFEKRYWLLPVLGLVGTIVSANAQSSAANAQAAAAEAAARAREKELEMQLALVREQQEHQMEMIKQIGIYGGAALGGVLLLRGLTR